MRSTGIALAALAWLSTTTETCAAYPERLIKVVVSAPAGTAPDIVIRLLGPKMSERLGQPLVIENKAGANGNLAAGEVAKAPADGYTILITVAGTMTANPFLYPKSTTAAINDLAPITQIATVDFIVAGKPDLAAKTFGDLVTQMRAQPGKFTAATTANGSFPHLAAEMLKQMAGIDFAIVKHNGGAAAGAAAAGSHVDFVVETLAVLQSLVQGGKLSPLATTGARRNTLSPDLPTISEVGVTGYSMTGWVAALAPPGTPTGLRATLQQSIAFALADGAIRQRLTTMQFVPGATTPDELAKIIAAERTQLRETIRRAGLVLE